MPIPDDAVRAFHLRASSDAGLRSVLGTLAGTSAARWFESHPDETLESDDFPRGTYMLVASSVVAAFPAARIQATGWFRRDDAAAFYAGRRSFQERMLELFNGGEGAMGAVWTNTDGRFMSSVIAGPRDLPAGPGDPVGLSMDLLIRVSAA